MKRFVGLTIATAAILFPVTPALASSPAAAPAPADYRPECEQFYAGGKTLFDALIASPAKAALNPLEVGLCGQAKHTA